MPIYHYRLARDVDRGCAYCEGGFEIMQKMTDDPLTGCPQCGQPVVRVISAPALVNVGGVNLGEKNIAEKGFTQYRRAGQGVYEKTAGKGPDYIADDGQ